MTDLITLVLAIGALALGVQVWRFLSAHIELAKVQTEWLELKMEDSTEPEPVPAAPVKRTKR